MLGGCSWSLWGALGGPDGTNVDFSLVLEGFGGSPPPAPPPTAQRAGTVEEGRREAYLPPPRGEEEGRICLIFSSWSTRPEAKRLGGFYDKVGE